MFGHLILFLVLFIVSRGVRDFCWRFTHLSCCFMRQRSCCSNFNLAFCCCSSRCVNTSLRLFSLLVEIHRPLKSFLLARNACRAMVHNELPPRPSVDIIFSWFSLFSLLVFFFKNTIRFCHKMIFFYCVFSDKSLSAISRLISIHRKVKFLNFLRSIWVQTNEWNEVQLENYCQVDFILSDWA